MTYNNPQPQSDPNQPDTSQSDNQQPQYSQYAQQPDQSAPQYQAPDQQAQQPEQPSQPPQQPEQPTYGQYAQYGQAQPEQPAYGQYAQQPGQPTQPEYGQYAPQSGYQQQTGYQPTGAQGYTQPQPGYNPNPYAQQQSGYAQQPGYAPQSGYGQQPAPGAPLPQGNPYYSYAPSGVPPIDQPWYGIGFGDAIKRLFAKAFTVKGRASRGEFWWAVLFFMLCNIGVDLITAALGTPGQVVAGIWSVIVSVLLIIIGIRRLHDTNRTGWLMLIPAIPSVISTIVSYTVGLEFLDDLQIFGNTVMRVQSEYELERLSEMFFVSNAGSIALIVGTSFVAIVGYVIGIVLLAGRTKPEGARFDA